MTYEVPTSYSNKIPKQKFDKLLKKCEIFFVISFIYADRFRTHENSFIDMNYLTNLFNKLYVTFLNSLFFYCNKITVVKSTHSFLSLKK